MYVHLIDDLRLNTVPILNAYSTHVFLQKSKGRVRIQAVNTLKNGRVHLVGWNQVIASLRFDVFQVHPGRFTAGT